MPAAQKQSAVLESAEGAAVYDRQIRLWGMETQKRISEAHILFAGLSGTSSEVCKNLLLGGVGAVTVMDPAAISEADLRVNFFLTPADVGKNRAEAAFARLRDLNPYVDLRTKVSDPAELSAKELSEYTMVCAAGSTAQLAKINGVCREAGVPFFGFGSAGFASFAFADLLDFKYNESIVENGIQKPPVERSLAYVPLQESISVPWADIPKKPHRLFFALKVLHEAEKGDDPEACCLALDKVISTLDATEGTRKRKRNSKVPDKIGHDYLRTTMEHAGTEICAVCAVMGGVVAQQVIRAISRKNAPLCNWLLFDNELGGASTMQVMK